MTTIFGVELVEFYRDGDHAVAGVAENGTTFILRSEKPCGNEDENDYITISIDCKKPEWDQSDEDEFESFKHKLEINL